MKLCVNTLFFAFGVNTYRQGWYFYKEYSIIAITGLK